MQNPFQKQKDHIALQIIHKFPQRRQKSKAVWKQATLLVASPSLGLLASAPCGQGVLPVTLPTHGAGGGVMEAESAHMPPVHSIHAWASLHQLMGPGDEED